MMLDFRANSGSYQCAVLAMAHMPGDCPYRRTLQHAVKLVRCCLLRGGQTHRGEKKSGGKKSGLYLGSSY